MKARDLFCIFFVVVITASVVRVAVPFPLTERDKESQRLASCQSNLRQMAVAIQMYWNDYDAVLPSSSSVTATPGTVPTQSEVINFVSGKDPYPRSETKRPESYAHLIWPHLKNKKAFFCPSDVLGSRASYWWKYAIDLAWRDPSITVRKEGEYEFITDQILIYEHSGFHSGESAGVKNGSRINAAYMDGHVGMVTITNGPANYPPAADERNGTAGTRLGAPMYYNFDNTTNQHHAGVANFIDPRRYSDRY